MENCVDISKFNTRWIVTIKEPGSSREKHGDAIKNIQCSIEEAKVLRDQLTRILRPATLTTNNEERTDENS